MPIKHSSKIALLYALLLVLLSGTNSFAGQSDEAKSRAMDYFIRGTVADQMQDYYRAIFHYQEALRFDSTSSFVYVALAQDYVLLENVREAEVLLNKALTLNADYVPALELKSVLMHGLNRLPEAQSCIERLIKVAPKEQSYPKQLLALYLEMGKFEKADDLYKKIAEKEGETEELLRQMLTVNLIAERYEHAIPYLEKLIVKDTTDAALVYTLGTAYLQKKDTLKAEALINRANTMNPMDPRYWLGKAALAFDRHDFEKSISIAKEALEKVGDQATLYSLMGTTQYRLENTTEAIPALEKAIQMDSTMFAAMGTLALIYDGMDSLDRAVELYEKTIQLTDSAVVYLNNLAYTFAEHDINLEQAKSLSEQAISIEPKNASYLDTMGWIEFKLGNYSDALHWLKKAADVDSKSAPILEHIGDVYSKKGSLSKAKNYYQKALEIEPNNKSLQEKNAR